MTSQVAVFNLECVAVASDSVMTVTRGSHVRTLPSSEKVLDLGDGHRVVVMTSGESRFMSVPYPVLLGEWQATLTQPLACVGDYPRAFVAWLAQRTDLFSEEAQEGFFAWQLDDFYRAVRGAIGQDLAEAGLAEAGWDERDVQTVVDAAIDRLLGALGERDDLVEIDPGADAFYLAQKTTLVEEAFTDVFDGTARTVTGDLRLRRELPALVLAKAEPWAYDSVLAFIGYGSGDVFPGHQVIELHGLVNGQVRVNWREPVAAQPSLPAIVVPFGQDEAIDTFLWAYNSEFLRIAHRRIDHALDLVRDKECLVTGTWEEEPDLRQGTHENLNDDFRRLSREQFIDPMLDTVESLPRTEMARMAEALVGIQALRAASSSRQPSVGGPIDVAVISRRHGVQWLRRKELSLNP